MRPNGALGHLTAPSWRSDVENDRKPTSGEKEVRQALEHSYTPGSERGMLAPPSRGPLAGIDLLHYCRTGEVRRLDRAALTKAQEGLV